MSDERRVEIRLDPIPPIARAYQGHRAGVITRTIAGAVDYLLVTVVLFAVYFGIAVLRFLIDPRSLHLPTVTLLQAVLVGWVVLFLYLLIGWWTTGRTAGARLMGLRVVDWRGERVPFLVAVARAAFVVVFPIGLFWCALSRSNRSVQDVVLRTSVVHDWSTPPPPPTDGPSRG